MKFDPPLLEAEFLSRPNRFAAVVKLRGEEIRVHVPDPGRMKELLTPGCQVFLKESRGEGRKTSHTLALTCPGGALVSTDTHLANKLVREALRARAFAPFAACSSFDEEVTVGDCRLDFALDLPDGRRHVEVKSVTLVVEDVARFPDAPTARGAKHMRTLAGLAKRGEKASVVFVVQRSDAAAFAPNDALDPAFGSALRDAAACGVEIHAVACRMSMQEIELAGELPVLL